MVARGPRRIALWFALVAGFAAACDLTPDDRYVGLEGRVPFFVATTSVSPGAVDVPLNQPITLELSQHLDPESFRYFNAITVASGGIVGQGYTRYRLTERTLTFFPTSDLRPGLVYTVAVNPDTVRSLRGEPLVVPFSVQFETSLAGVTVEQEGRTVAERSFAAEVEPLFEVHCSSCHGGSEALEPLTYEALFADSQQTDPPRPLVRPFSPEGSYLLHKLVPDYPDRRHTVMPPPWSDVAPLALEDVRVVEEWILTGAAP